MGENNLSKRVKISKLGKQPRREEIVELTTFPNSPSQTPVCFRHPSNRRSGNTR